MQSRLKGCLDQPTGMNFETAMAAAEQNLAQHRATALQGLDKAIASAQALGRSGGTSAENLIRLSEVAADIACVAGAYGLEELSAVANGLAKATAPNVVADARAILVHVEALPLLRSTSPAEADHRRSIVAGLAKVLAKQIGA
ncbi:MAG: hypothetical protein JNK30_10420 [Phenylobacterium sp.]|uniref:hypothetical protein n=1 Tax=Phenylobacterium sp. TaxID=1871053 RepID=UPI001A59E4A7|nr:hypothetical protein [Phenylobacterium sp.]MBL8771785.1 hypothetical protein [Phenylobacterium sp.]